jgi:tRNA nucleotidyltransferase (CCA-adding enzyme)
MKELRQILLNAEKPSAFFEQLRAKNALSPALAPLAALVGVPQNPAYHAEGDVWNHTMLVLDAAAVLRPQAQQPLGLMLAALCHDLGKALTTQEKDGRIISHGHEAAGVPLARSLLRALGVDDPELTDYVCNMVSLHMRPNALAAQGSSEKATNRLFRESICPADLVLLAAADRNGRITTQQATDDAARVYLAERLKKFLGA